MKNRGVAIILALLFGWLGFHKFYLGRMGAGVVYLIFFWTWIPALLSLIDVIVLIFMKEGTFQRKYGYIPQT